MRRRVNISGGCADVIPPGSVVYGDNYVGSVVGLQFSSSSCIGVDVTGEFAINGDTYVGGVIGNCGICDVHAIKIHESARIDFGPVATTMRYVGGAVGGGDPPGRTCELRGRGGLARRDPAQDPEDVGSRGRRRPIGRILGGAGHDPRS